MQERGGIVAGSLVVLVAVLPLGALFHASSRFPGSLLGSLLGITAAVLMIIPFIYLLIKRVPFLNSTVTRLVSMRTLLAVHIYAGLFGPVLALLHSAHKFRSPLGISLVGMMLVVVLSGYCGRFLLGRISRSVQARRSELAQLHAAFRALPPEPLKRAVPGWAAWLFRRVDSDSGERTRLASALIDAEQAVRLEELIRAVFTRWLRLHIALAAVLYTLLALHAWSGFYYGFRWLQ